MVSGESAQITPNEDARLAPNNRSIEVADRQLADNFTGATTNYSVANNSRNVNEDVKYKLNPEHEAQVKSQKAAAQGANGANAARADLGRANALSSEIDNLGRQQNTYSGNKVQYNAKDLDSYKVEGDTAVGVSDPQATGNDPTLNIYNTRLKQEDERKRQNQYL